MGQLQKHKEFIKSHTTLFLHRTPHLIANRDDSKGVPLQNPTIIVSIATLFTPKWCATTLSSSSPLLPP
jgi:hypothetical protein